MYSDAVGAAVEAMMGFRSYDQIYENTLLVLNPAGWARSYCNGVVPGYCGERPEVDYLRPNAKASH